MLNNRQKLSGGGFQGGIISRRQGVHTYNDIISLNNLLLAWQEFIKGKRNRKDVQEFLYRLFDNIFALHADLKNNTYQHGGYEAFKINDPKPRDIHKAKVRDRLLHHAIYRTLYPFLIKRLFLIRILAGMEREHIKRWTGFIHLRTQCQKTIQKPFGS